MKEESLSKFFKKSPKHKKKVLFKVLKKSIKEQNKMKPIICGDCFWCIKDDDGSFCKVIENEHGGSIETNRTECDSYLKRGTEPQEPCALCGKNTFGEHATWDSTGKYHTECHWKIEDEKEEKEREKKLAELRRLFYKEYKDRFLVNNDIKKIADWWIEKLGE